MIIVTGSSGFIGDRIIKKLNKSDVIGIDLNAPLTQSYRHIQTDISDTSSVAHLEFDSGVDAIVHCAAIISPLKCQADPHNAVKTNVLGTINMLELARRLDVSKFIYISTGGIYKNSNPTDIVNESWPIEPRGIYGISKFAAESIVRDYAFNYSIPSVALRITAPYGPGMVRLNSLDRIPDAISRHTLIFAIRCVRGSDIVMPIGGEHTVNYTYVDDIVAGVKCALDAQLSGFEAFNITGGKNYSILELGEAVKSLCPGLKVNIGRGDLTNGFNESDPMLSRLSIKQGLFDISKAREKLGYKPIFDLKSGMERLIEYLRGNQDV
jgi:nucleoside-diphosphate-sugar epimerase